LNSSASTARSRSRRKKRVVASKDAINATGALLKKAFFLAAALVSFCRYTKRTLIHVMVHGLVSLILTKYTAELFKMNRKKNS